MDKQLDLSALQDSIASLGDGLDIVSDPEWFNEQTVKVQNALISGVVKNFEFVFEISIKMLKRMMELESSSLSKIDEGNFKDLLRTAGEKGLIADVQAWFNYRKMRNITAHTYDHQKAQQVYLDTLKFIVDARALLAALELRNG